MQRKKIKRPDLSQRNRENATHGMSNSPEYYIWRSMKARCYNKKSKNYNRYGGRGISVCRKWLISFENFLKDMGLRPKGYQLDRINNDGNYCKSNCRWSTPRENANNRRSSRLFEYNGKLISIAEMARINGITRQGMRYRIESGYSIERAITKDDKYVKGNKR